MKILGQKEWNVGDYCAEKDNKGTKACQQKSENFPAADFTDEIREVEAKRRRFTLRPFCEMKLYRYCQRQGQNWQGKGIEPAENGKGSTNLRVDSGAEAENACVEASSGITLTTGEDVTDEGDVQVAQRSSSQSLQQAQSKKEPEVSRQSA